MSDLWIPIVCALGVALVIGLLCMAHGYERGFRDSQLFHADSRPIDSPPGVDSNSKGGMFRITHDGSFHDIGSIRGSRVFVIPATSCRNFLELVPQVGGSTMIMLALTTEAWAALRGLEEVAAQKGNQ